MILLVLLLLAGCTAKPVLDTGLSNPPKTKYPIVLHHGFLGSKSLLWPKGSESLSSLGFQVYAAEVPPALPIDERAKLLAEQIDYVLRVTRAGKVNLVAHSMGGLDSRYLVSTLGYGDRVASLSTIATPHRGSPLAEHTLEKLSFLTHFMNVAARLFTGTNPLLNADARTATSQLTEQYVEREFNPKNPDDPRVYYQSWAAAIAPGTRTLLAPYHEVIRKKRGLNDGMVPVSSAAWGVFRGTIEADHIEITGVLDRFDYRDFLVRLASELHAMGY